MKTIDPTLLALLNQQGPLWMADLFTFTLVGGTILRYTSADRALTFGGNTWTLGPVIKRGSTRITSGIEVDTLDVTVSAPYDFTVNNTPLMSFLAHGGLDGAILKLERAFAAVPGDPIVGTLVLFVGRVADIEVTRAAAQLRINSHTELLDVKIPRNIFQPGCHNTLYDQACGLNRASYTVSGAVVTGLTPTDELFKTNLTQANDYFDLGAIQFTSGANNGLKRAVKDFTSTNIQLLLPLPFAPAIGDTFTIYPGCDKLQTTCTTKFNNIIRFRGQPYIPVPETVT